MEERSVRFWDRIASRSSQTASELGGTALDTAVVTKHYLKSTDHLLDFGCGLGDLSCELAGQVTTVTGTDISSKMIYIAQSRAEKKNLSNITFSQMDIEQLIQNKQTFDAITIFNVLHHIDDVPHMLQKINQLLPWSGLLISSTACLGEHRNVSWFLLNLSTKMKILPDMNFFKTETLENVIKQSGFNLIAKKKLSRLPDYFIVARKVAR